MRLHYVNFSLSTKAEGDHFAPKWNDVVKVNSMIYLLLAFLIAFLAYTGNLDFDPYIFGRDYFAYWASFQLLLEGGNPYNIEELNAIQAKFNGPLSGPMFYPPSIFCVLFPFLLLNFTSSLLAWSLFNIILIIFICEIIDRLVMTTITSFKARALAVVTFLPFFYSLKFGQLSILTAFVLYSLVWLSASSRSFLSGILFGLNSLKPHLVYLPVIASLFFNLSFRKASFFLGVLISISLLASLAYLLSSDLIENFLQSTNNPVVWQTPTLTSFIRTTLDVRLSNVQLQMFACVLPFMCVTYLFLIWRSGRLKADFSFYVRILLFLSIASVPYLWVFDFSVLFILHYEIIKRLLSLNFLKRADFYVYIGFCMLSYGMTLAGYGDHHFWIYPFFLFFFWYLIVGQVRKSENF